MENPETLPDLVRRIEKSARWIDGNFAMAAGRGGRGRKSSGVSVPVAALMEKPVTTAV